MPLITDGWQVCPDIDPFNPWSGSTGPGIAGAPMLSLAVRSLGYLASIGHMSMYMCVHVIPAFSMGAMT